MQDQHTQEPVAEVCATSYRANDGDVHTRIEIRRLQNVKVGTLLYAFPPDAEARIAVLEKQRDTLLATIERLLDFSSHHKSCMKHSGFSCTCGFDAAIASVKEQV